MSKRLLGLTLFALFVRAGPLVAQEALAIVVHPKAALANLSSDDLRRYFLGQRTSLPSGEAVQLAESASLRDRFYGSALGMKGDRFKRHWISMVFSGEAAIPPRDFATDEQVIAFVSNTPGALGFVAASAATNAVKVVSIGGVKPTDNRYPVR